MNGLIIVHHVFLTTLIKYYRIKLIMIVVSTQVKNIVMPITKAYRNVRSVKEVTHSTMITSVN